MALVIAVALFVAQAINFALIYQGRRQMRIQQAVSPALTRVLDAEERIAAGRFRPGPRARVRLAQDNPVSNAATGRADIEQALRAALIEAGIKPGRIVSEVRRIQPDDPLLQLMPPRRVERLLRSGRMLVIGVERADGTWLELRSIVADDDGRLLGVLIVQTLITYIVILLPLLWITRRISRPIQSLAAAAEGFKPGGSAEPPIEASGPIEVRVLVEAFNALRTRVGAMLDEKDRMLGAIGHDLRTPLAALRVRIESVEDDADRATMAETIAEMSRMLDDILSLARLGRPSEPASEVDVGALVDAVAADFQALGAAVTCAPVDRITLRLRPALMRRAVRNLVENAVKYAGAAEILVAADRAGVTICVVDSGPGLPPDQLDRVFDAFTRLEASRNSDTGGAGLGLTLARAIVQEAGGTLTLANRPEGGLAATITLPRGA
ncbi:MAG: HAMP domain-containing histidine kinase [Sphingomonas sp.]|nr:HAMP domain-containing histidine kinase [Sphingomonas sp.]